MNNYFLRLMQVSVFCLDVCCLNLSNLICNNWLHISLTSFQLEYMNLLMWMNISWVGSAWLINLYNRNYILVFEPFFRRTLKTYILWLILVVSYLFFFATVHYFQIIYRDCFYHACSLTHFYSLPIIAYPFLF